MKIEFNESEFNSSINSGSAEIHSADFERGKRLLSENGSFILGIFALALALSNIPFGLFMNLSTEILGKLTEHGLEHWIFVLFTVMSLVLLFSVLLGVFSIVLFARSDKKPLHCAGLVLAIISFVLCALCLALNIVGLTAW